MRGSSVVPPVTEILAEMLDEYLQLTPLVVGAARPGPAGQLLALAYLGTGDVGPRRSASIPLLAHDAP